jgi:hypothetical protein
MADFGRKNNVKRHGNQKAAQSLDGRKQESRGDERDDYHVYCRFLKTLCRRQVEGNDWLVYTIDLATHHFAAALLKSEGFRSAMSSVGTPAGRLHWNGEKYVWSIRRFDRTELYGRNEHGHTEDFVLRLFVEEAGFNVRSAGQTRVRWRP